MSHPVAIVADVPPRTTPRQRIVALVKEHYAQPGDTVTESKSLPDRAAGIDREVDVVAETENDGVPVVICFEVVDWKRPAGVPWVEQMIQKHRHMPTSVLVLVSWSGFSKSAMQKADLNGVMAVTPTEDPSTKVAKLLVDQVQFTPDYCGLMVRLPDGTLHGAQVDGNTAVYNAAGAEVANVSYLARHVARSGLDSERIMGEIHNSESRETATHFRLFDENAAKMGLYLHGTSTETGEHAELLIEQVDVRGAFKFEQTPLDFQAMTLLGKRFVMARGHVFGKDTVWVGSPIASEEWQGAGARLTGRAVDGTPFVFSGPEA